jgi:hypothetical protein
MIIFFTVLLAVAMFATLGVLLAGMLGLVRGGSDPARSNRLMRLRVMLQAATIILFIVLMGLLHH